jgi:hypothetical protein
VFFGVLRYNNFLKIFTDIIFSSKPTIAKQDENLYKIITYITIFRLDELPLNDYKLILLVSI